MNETTAACMWFLNVPLNPDTPHVFSRFEAELLLSLGVKDDPKAAKPFTLTVPGGVDGQG